MAKKSINGGGRCELEQETDGRWICTVEVSAYGKTKRKARRNAMKLAKIAAKEAEPKTFPWTFNPS